MMSIAVVIVLALSTALYPFGFWMMGYCAKIPVRHITCNVERASVTCNFKQDMNIDRRPINVVRYPASASTKTPGHTVLLCQWKDSKNTYDCEPEKGFSVVGDITKHLKLRLSDGIANFTGLYKCFIVQAEEDTQSNACELIVKENAGEPTGNVTQGGRNSDDAQQKDEINLLWLIIIPVFIAIVGLVIAYTYRQKRKKTSQTPSVNEDVKDECRSSLIPTTSQNNLNETSPIDPNETSPGASRYLIDPNETSPESEPELKDLDLMSKKYPDQMKEPPDKEIRASPEGNNTTACPVSVKRLLTKSAKGAPRKLTWDDFAHHQTHTSQTFVLEPKESGVAFVSATLNVKNVESLQAHCFFSGSTICQQVAEQVTKLKEDGVTLSVQSKDIKPVDKVVIEAKGPANNPNPPSVTVEEVTGIAISAPKKLTCGDFTLDQTFVLKPDEGGVAFVSATLNVKNVESLQAYCFFSGSTIGQQVAKQVTKLNKHGVTLSVQSHDIKPVDKVVIEAKVPANSPNPPKVTVKEVIGMAIRPPKKLTCGDFALSTLDQTFVLKPDEGGVAFLSATLNVKNVESLQARCFFSGSTTGQKVDKQVTKLKKHDVTLSVKPKDIKPVDKIVIKAKGRPNIRRPPSVTVKEVTGIAIRDMGKLTCCDFAHVSDTLNVKNVESLQAHCFFSGSTTGQQVAEQVTNLKEDGVTLSVEPNNIKPVDKVVIEAKGPPNSRYNPSGTVKEVTGIAISRPTILEGIGQKPEFQKLGLELKSHTSAEISTKDNIFDITIKSPKQPVTIIFKLMQYKNGEEKELPEGVFIQKKDDDVVFHLALPEPAWYKLNIFAIKLDAAESTLPCVFTYLIDLKRAKKAVKPYPKAFADFAKGWYLHKPLFLDTTKDLSKVHFKVEVKGTKQVAVKAADDWFQLTKQGGDLWEGDVNLQRYRGKGVPVNLNACRGSDENSFATLLQYTV